MIKQLKQSVPKAIQYFMTSYRSRLNTNIKTSDSYDRVSNTACSLFLHGIRKTVVSTRVPCIKRVKNSQILLMWLSFLFFLFFVLVGSVCVAIAFIFIFQPCIGCDDNTDTWAKFIYYVPFLFLAQFGWASVQISHLALIPELTSCEHERVELNTIRWESRFI